MICDPCPVFCLSEDGTDLEEGQFTEDPQFEDFPVGFVQRVQRGVNPEGEILVRYLLFNTLSRGGKVLGNRRDFVPAARFIHEAVLRDGTQPGDLVRFVPERGFFGEGSEERFLGDLLSRVPVASQRHHVGEDPHIISIVKPLAGFVGHTSSPPSRFIHGLDGET